MHMVIGVKKGLCVNGSKNFRFSKYLRLLTSADFKAVFREAEAIRSTSKFFTVLGRPNQLENARLGLIVARKQLKRAVDRNRIKRIIRESFRLGQDKLKGLDFVVILRCDIFKEKNSGSVREVLEQQWREVILKWKKSPQFNLTKENLSDNLSKES